jgi:hypothetical protein
MDVFIEGRGGWCPVWRAYHEPEMVEMVTKLKARVAECKQSFQDLESVRFRLQACMVGVVPVIFLSGGGEARLRQVG